MFQQDSHKRYQLGIVEKYWRILHLRNCQIINIHFGKEGAKHLSEDLKCSVFRGDTSGYKALGKAA